MTVFRLHEELFQATPDAIVAVDTHGRVVLFNTQAERLFGYFPLEISGRPFEVLIWETPRWMRTELRAPYGFGEWPWPMASGMELSGLRKDGSERIHERTIGKHLFVLTSLAPDVSGIVADKREMERMLVNLALIARDAKSGTMMIETCNLEIDEYGAREHVGLVPGHYVRLGVSDNGRGMEGLVFDHAFEPFFTTKAKGRGLGAGARDRGQHCHARRWAFRFRFAGWCGNNIHLTVSNGGAVRPSRRMAAPSPTACSGPRKPATKGQTRGNHRGRPNAWAGHSVSL